MSSRIIRGHSATILCPALGPAGQSPLLTTGGECHPDTILPSPPPAASNEEGVAEAHERGLKEGHRIAVEEQAAAAAALGVQVAKTVAHLINERPRLRREAESDVVRLALAIARRIIHRELSLDPHAIQGLVRVAIDGMNKREIVRIRTHPSHTVAVSQVLDASHIATHVDLTSDSTLAVGDLILETSHGELDASIDSQLKEIDLGITDRLGR